jgi:GNAT superfamily N-acetyltransferase
VYEFYVVPHQPRLHVFSLFEALLAASRAVSIDVQSNDPLALVMLHTYARDVISESILFHDQLATSLSPPGAAFRAPTGPEAPDVPAAHLKWCGVVEVEKQVAASGGILFHYNRPYGDIYMEVAEPFRGRGCGSFLVQELKRVCYEGGHVRRHGAVRATSRLDERCRRLVSCPCGHILTGAVGNGGRSR